MENNKLGCNVFSKPLVPVTLPVFLLVDRGDCYFVEKVCKSFHPFLFPGKSQPCLVLLRLSGLQPHKKRKRVQALAGPAVYSCGIGVCLS